MFDMSFYKGKNVLVTGHTGFKGAWLCEVLLYAGADVTGYALEPPTQPALFELLDLEGRIRSIIGDVRNFERLKKVFEETQPEIVIHMAAQPIVRESYINPVYTYDVNVMGTVNVLECIRLTGSVKSFVNVTTDKVYKNKEWEWGYRENEELNGYDPYSNSKSCSELVTESYKNSFFQERDISISTVRAGNVIGGGDFAKDRIIPDCVKAAMGNREIVVRNAGSIRPYQYVLDPLLVYLMIAQKQYENVSYAGNYNVGADDAECYTTGDLVTLFCNEWRKMTGEKVLWKNIHDSRLHEANCLRLDCSKLKALFKWKPIWNVEQAVKKVVEWTVAYQEKKDFYELMYKQIKDLAFVDTNSIKYF